jgi:hypothetical protein
MPTENISVSQKDLDQLGSKLDKADLTEDERKLLVATFAAAGRAVSAESENDTSGYSLPGASLGTFGGNLSTGLSTGFGGSLSSGLRGDLANRAIIISVGF